MKTPQAFSRWFISFITISCLPLITHAQQAANPALDGAISSGDFNAYLASASAWLTAKVPADTNRITAASLKLLVKDPALNAVLAQRTLIAKYGAANLGTFAKADKENAAFLSWLMRNTKAMELYLEGSTPTGLKAREDGNWTLREGSLETWKKIYYADPESRDGMYLRLAIGASIGPQGSNSRGAGGQPEPLADPVSRYTYFKTAHKNRELFPSFDKLNVWEYSKVTSSHARDADLTWGRNMINTYRPDFREGEKVVQLVSSVWRRNSPVSYTNMATVLQGGGKCGPRSSFGVFINQAFGIPSIGVAQPAHACTAWRDTDGVWQVGYGKGWAASRLEGLVGMDFVDGSMARANAAQFSETEHMRWLAAAVTSKDQANLIARLATRTSQVYTGKKVDPNASFNADEANADPGVEKGAAKPAAAKLGVIVTKKAPVVPVKAVNGVMHIEAAKFTKTEGQGMFFNQPGVMLHDSYTPEGKPEGSKQVYFAQQMNYCWTEYDVDVPAAGEYEVKMKAASINDDQTLLVGCGTNKETTIWIPMSYGLWQESKPEKIKLGQGLQKIKVSAPNQRGVALKWIEFKPKGK